MPRRRGRGWMIDLFLWVCPLAGVGVFVFVLLAGKLPPPQGYWDKRWFFEVPGKAWLVLPTGALLVPLLVAQGTRRRVGFAAGASLILIAATATLWVRSQWVTDKAGIIRIKGSSSPAKFDALSLCSRGGGIALMSHASDDETTVKMTRKEFLNPGLEQTLFYGEFSPEARYPCQDGNFSKTPALLRKMGFGATLNANYDKLHYPYRIPFAIALPYWFLCLLAAPLPLAWTIRFRRRRRTARRAASGLCKNCGYDLRATPDGSGTLLAICPECGAAATTAAVAGGSPSQTKK